VSLKGKSRKERNEPVPNDPLSLIANLLALLVVKDMSEGDKIVTLSAVGFKNQEIARLLGKDINTVHQVLFQKRNRNNKTKSPKK
jgi:DNA-binding NarL/FixJ family response regulator